MARGRKKYVLCGYYGRGNLGDEMILEAILRTLGADASGTIRRELSKSSHLSKGTPPRTPHKRQAQLPYPPKIRVLSEKNPFLLLRDMLGADVFAFGGGSLLQNSTSNASLFYYLALIFASRLLCRRRVMLANGIGPIKSSVFSKKFLENLIKNAVKTFDSVTVRDSGSQKFLQNMLTTKKISLLPDPALLLFEPKINPRLRKSGRFLYIPCALGLKRAKIDEKTVAKTLRAVEGGLGAEVFFAVLNENEDEKLAQGLSKRLGGRKICAPKSAAELEKALSEADFTVCQRFHGALFSAALGVPTVCVSDDPKMTALCEDFGLCEAVSPKTLADFSVLLREIEAAKGHFYENGRAILQKFQAARGTAESTIKEIL